MIYSILLDKVWLLWRSSRRSPEKVLGTCRINFPGTSLGCQVRTYQGWSNWIFSNILGTFDVDIVGTTWEPHWWVLVKTKHVSVDRYVLTLFIEHTGEYWCEQNIFCFFATSQAFWQSSAPGALSTLVTSVVL